MRVSREGDYQNEEVPEGEGEVSAEDEVEPESESESAYTWLVPRAANINLQSREG